MSPLLWSPENASGWLAEFPASGRLYLNLVPADRPRLEACLAQFNRDA